MRVSRAVSLSVLTLGLTVGGITAAAADTATTVSSSTTAGGAASSFTHTLDGSFAAGSNSTSAKGIATMHTEAGKAEDGAAYYGTAATHVTTEGVRHTGTFVIADPSRRHGDDERDKRCRHDDKHGDHRGDFDRGRDRGDEHEGLVGDVLEDLL